MYGWLQSIEFKSVFIERFLTPIITSTILILVWSSIYQVQDVVGGFTWSQMVAYLIINQIMIEMMFYDVRSTIGNKIRSGTIIMWLVRPVNMFKALTLENFGSAGLRFMSMTVIGGLLLFLLPLGISFSQHWWLLIIHFLLIFVFDFFIMLTIGLLSFWFVETWGFHAVYGIIRYTLAGVALPLSVFSATIQNVLAYTPFYHAQYSFASAIIQPTSMVQILEHIVVLGFWSLCAVALSYIVFSYAKKKVQVFGG